MADITKINLKGTELNIRDAGAARQTDLPTKVSELDNDSGFITASDVSGIVAGSGDVVITETSDYIDIFIYGAEIGISPNMLSLYAAQKSATITVSGSHLKSDISISVPTGFTASPSTIAHVNGTVAETNVIITYTGADASTASGNITATAGDATKSIPVVYSQYQGATIIADSTLTIKAAAGGSNTGTLSVTGVNLEGNITATLGGTDASKFSVSGSPITQSGGSASGTLTITYSPSANDSSASATLTLSSTNATSVTVALTGAVSTITTSVASLSLSTDQGVSTTGTFTVEGSNLREDISISASGDYISVSPSMIAHSSGSVTSTTVTVTYNPSASGSHSGTITIQSSGVTKTVSVSGTATAATTSDAEGKFTKEINGKTIYFKRLKVNDEFTNNVGVYNSNYNTSSASSTLYSGAISIPATVACDGTTYNVTTIAGYAFGGCTGLTSLTIAEGITTISVNAIRGCTNNSFTSLTIPNSVTSFGQNNLYECNKLTNIVIGDGVTAIGQYFDTVGTISNITIGSSVASIGKYSMIKMSDSGTVTIKRTTPPSIEGVVFKTSAGGYPCNATLKVPSEAVNTYKTSSLWGVDGTGGANWHQFNPDNIEAISE